MNSQGDWVLAVLATYNQVAVQCGCVNPADRIWSWYLSAHSALSSSTKRAGLAGARARPAMPVSPWFQAQQQQRQGMN